MGAALSKLLGKDLTHPCTPVHGSPQRQAVGASSPSRFSTHIANLSAFSQTLVIFFL